MKRRGEMKCEIKATNAAVAWARLRSAKFTADGHVSRRDIIRGERGIRCFARPREHCRPSTFRTVPWLETVAARSMRPKLKAANNLSSRSEHHWDGGRAPAGTSGTV